jgi:hypothetical protein
LKSIFSPDDDLAAGLALCNRNISSPWIELLLNSPERSCSIDGHRLSDNNSSNNITTKETQKERGRGGQD